MFLLDTSELLAYVGLKFLDLPQRMEWAGHELLFSSKAVRKTL